MAQDSTTGGVAPTETAMDITPKPGASAGGAAPPAAPAADTAAPKEPTRTAMDITPDDAG